MGPIHISRNIKPKGLLSDYSNLSPNKTTNHGNTNTTSENDNSDSLLPSKQGDSSNMSSSNDEGRVAAVVAKVRYKATKNQVHWRSKQPGWRCTSDKNPRVLLDSGSDRDLMFHENGTIMHFPYLTRQVPISWHKSNGSFLTKGGTEVILLTKYTATEVVFFWTIEEELQ